jgi:hypothetical protein
MNALSALRSLAYPALRADPLKAAADAAAPKSIPFTELEKLSPGLLAQPLDAAKPAGGSRTIKTSWTKPVANRPSPDFGQNPVAARMFIAPDDCDGGMSISANSWSKVRNKPSNHQNVRMGVIVASSDDNPFASRPTAWRPQGRATHPEPARRPRANSAQRAVLVGLVRPVAVLWSSPPITPSSYGKLDDAEAAKVMVALADEGARKPAAAAHGYGAVGQSLPDARNSPARASCAVKASA